LIRDSITKMQETREQLRAQPRMLAWEGGGGGEGAKVGCHVGI